MYPVTVVSNLWPCAQPVCLFRNSACFFEAKTPGSDSLEMSKLQGLREFDQEKLIHLECQQVGTSFGESRVKQQGFSLSHAFT